MSKVILKGHIIVPEADIAAVSEELPNHIALTRSENGCVLFDVSQDQDNRYRFNVYEEFDGPDSFKLHQERVSSSTWGAITANVQRYYSVEGLEN